MLIRNVMIVCAALVRVAAAADDGPTSLMTAAQQSAYADTLIQSCRYDEAERWIDMALHSARDTRSNTSLVRDMAGTFVGSLEVKTQEFREQRKSWDRTLQRAREQFDASRLESAGWLLRQAGAPGCDPRFHDLFARVEGRSARAATLVQRGDRDLSGHSPRSALRFYLQAQALDVEFPGIGERLADAKAHIPRRCIACTVGKVIIVTAVLGGLAYGGYYSYQQREQAQKNGAFAH